MFASDFDSDKRVSQESSRLRQRAEAYLHANPAARSSFSEEDILRLVHELEVYQIELEMQNEELRQARQQAESLLEKYTALYDFAPVGYLTLDRNGFIQSVNRAGAELLKVDRGHLLGQSFAGHVTEKDLPTFARLIESVFLHPGRETCEVELRGEEGNQVFLQVEAVAAAAGQSCRVAIIDISVRRQLELQLERQHAELAEHAAQLEAVNVELEAFNYSVSHDLRTSLTIISLSYQVLTEICGDQLNEQAQKILREINNGALRIDQLITSLLQFGRTMRMEMHCEEVDLSQLAEMVTAECRLRARNCQAQFQIAQGLTCKGDQILLRTVLENLIGNAVKYAGQQQGALIEFGQRDLSGQAVYYVKDNGPGFDMANAANMIKPFWRLPGTNVEGLGIGLATVERAIHRHGGRFWIESAPGKGASFYFTLSTESNKTA